MALGVGIVAFAMLAAAPWLQAGACCVNDFCQDITQGECDAAFGEYHGDPTTCETISCTSGEALFREYDPVRPPMILTDPGIRAICMTPYPDLDPVPAGTTLVFYRVGDQGFPDPSAPDYIEIMMTPGGWNGQLDWTGADCTQGSACCIAPDVCHLVRDQDACETVYSGLYAGDGVDCSMADCSMPSGACCEGIGQCSDTPELACAGMWMGEGTDCASYTCEGSCCLFDASCVEAAHEDECLALNGGFGGDGTNCSMFVCNGACCLQDNSCVETPNAPECEAQNGTFQGDGSDCALIDCGAIDGACCDALGRCTDGTDEECFQAGGTFQGPGTDCATVDCMDQPGACCEARGVCITEVPSMCPGEHKGINTDCANFACEGACCLPDETCVMVMGEGECTAMNGEWQGDGTDCLTTDCRTPIGACCDAVGGCIETTQVECENAGSRYMGDETLCALVDCGDRPGACCEALDVCVEVLESACTGEFQGMDTFCIDYQCRGACCLMDQSCIEVMGQEECEVGNLGEWQGDGTECITVDCTRPIAACCLPGAICVMETEAICGTIGGTWQGEGTNCATVDCPF
jgi:hypothetical protein